MIRINWSEVESVKTQLLRGGATDSHEMTVIIFYHNRSDCDKLQIQLAELEEALFDIGSNHNVKGLFLYDLAMKKPYLKCEEVDRASALESVPLSGHPSVVTSFGKMSPEARDVWIEIAIAQQQHYVNEGV